MQMRHPTNESDISKVFIKLKLSYAYTRVDKKNSKNSCLGKNFYYLQVKH
jgi:hypothetical protein